MSAARARAGAGRAYARAWRARAPRSARARPWLPPEPLSRRFGLDRGRPVDRVYIERFLARNADDLRGRGVEIYEPTYLERFGACSVVDVLDAAPDAPRATIHGGLDALPADAFDCFVLTQTLNLVAEPAVALAQARDALRVGGGVLLATMPGISHLSLAGAEGFSDHWRFTAHGLRALAAPLFRSVEVVAHGNVQAAAAFLYGMAEHELEPATWTRDDGDFEVVVCLRAVR